MLRLGLILAALVFALDQVSKWWIVARVLNPPRVVEVTPFLNIVLVRNRGVSFGALNTDSAILPWVLSGIAAAVVIGLVVWLARVRTKLLAAAIGLVIGGAVGNLLDRVRSGAVTDFVDLHAGSAHWPTFNLADSAIVIGVGMLIYDSLFRRADSPKQS